jgi:hypothetical protein
MGMVVRKNKDREGQYVYSGRTGMLACSFLLDYKCVNKQKKEWYTNVHEVCTLFEALLCIKGNEQKRNGDVMHLARHRCNMVYRLYGRRISLRPGTLGCGNIYIRVQG